MGELYWGLTVVLIVLSFIGLVISTIVYLIDKSDPFDKYRIKEVNKKNAVRTLFFLAAIPGAFAWPVLIPLALAYLTYKLIQDVRK